MMNIKAAINLIYSAIRFLLQSLVQLLQVVHLPGGGFLVLGRDVALGFLEHVLVEIGIGSDAF